MDLFSLLQRLAQGTLRALPALLLSVVSVSAGPSAIAGLTIHGPEETLRDFCVAQDGKLWLILPGGSRHELVTSISDPAIINQGDGSFHPFEETQVHAAIAALRTSIAPLHAEVFLLPYPRRAGLESAAGPGLILLSPGVRPLTPQHQHSEFVHELGHLVHFSRMPEAAVAEWSRYRRLRGITDESVYCASAPHADRPHEIFAEDFRALIGGTLANYSGTIENHTLAAPATVAGLEEFVRTVAGASGPMSGVPLACFPNPSSAAVSFIRSGDAGEALEIYDLGGRRVATLQPAGGTGVVTWRWDGRDQHGAPVGAGVFFARLRTGGAALRLSRVR